jgi:pimeloyl-ACP methyl ester carboxylesterase
MDGTATIDDLVADLGDVIAKLGGSVDLLLGHSLGASVAIQLVCRRPGMVRRLVLEDPPAVIRADDVDFQERLRAEVLAARGDPQAEVERTLRENPRWLEEDARQDVEGRALADLEGILAFLRGRRDAPTLVELARSVAVPTLWLLADEERSALGGGRERVLASLSDTARAQSFDSGHTVHRDRFEEYMLALLGWLARR